MYPLALIPFDEKQSGGDSLSGKLERSASAPEMRPGVCDGLVTM
jgi:hypothetical protein